MQKKLPASCRLFSRPNNDILFHVLTPAPIMNYKLQWAASSLSNRAVDHSSPRVMPGHHREKDGVNVAVSSSQRERWHKRGEPKKQGNPKHFTWISSDSKSESRPSVNQMQAWVMMSSFKPSSVTDCF